MNSRVLPYFRPAIAVLLSLVGSIVTSANEPTRKAFRIAGYLPDYRAADIDWANATHLTDLLLFSAEPTSEGKLDVSRLKAMPWAKLRAFKTLHRQRLILCIGGWERSQQFPAVVSSDSKRAEFVKSCVRLCLDERLDGVDLDWEHPNTAAEQGGYASLLRELRTAFEPHGLTLSVTVAAWQKVPKAAFEGIDWVQVMAYDHPGQHSTFENSQKDVAAVHTLGAPMSKIVLGLPLYGRDVKKTDRVLTYREILTKHKPARESNEADGLYFNGPQMMEHKTQWALESKLGGVMLWELGQDATSEQSLLRIVGGVVNKKQ
jgi:chitinase